MQLRMQSAMGEVGSGNVLGEAGSGGTACRAGDVTRGSTAYGRNHVLQILFTSLLFLLHQLLK